jgi:hypothetical protein
MDGGGEETAGPAASDTSLDLATSDGPPALASTDAASLGAEMGKGLDSRLLPIEANPVIDMPAGETDVPDAAPRPFDSQPGIDAPISETGGLLSDAGDDCDGGCTALTLVAVDTPEGRIQMLAMPGQVEVFVKKGSTGIDGLLTSLGGRTITQIPAFDYFLVSVVVGSEAAFIAAATQDPRILLAAPDLVLVENSGKIVDIEPQRSATPGGTPTGHAKLVQDEIASCLKGSTSMSVERQDTPVFNGASITKNLFLYPIVTPVSEANMASQIKSAVQSAIAGGTFPSVLNISMGPVAIVEVPRAESLLSGGIRYRVYDSQAAFETQMRQYGDMLISADEIARMRRDYESILIAEYRVYFLAMAKVLAGLDATVAKDVVITQSSGNTGIDLSRALPAPGTPEARLLREHVAIVGSSHSFSNRGPDCDVILETNASAVDGTSFAAPCASAGIARILDVLGPSATATEALQVMRDASQSKPQDLNAAALTLAGQRTATTAPGAVKVANACPTTCVGVAAPTLLTPLLKETVCSECRPNDSGYQQDANFFEIPLQGSACETTGQLQIHGTVLDSAGAVVWTGNWTSPYTAMNGGLRVGELWLWSRNPPGSGWGDATDVLEFQYVDSAANASNVVSWSRKRKPACEGIAAPVLLAPALKETVCFECRPNETGYPQDANIFEIPFEGFACEPVGMVQVHGTALNSAGRVLYTGNWTVPYTASNGVLRVGEQWIWSRTPSGSGWGDDTDVLEFQYVDSVGNSSNSVSWSRTRLPAL